MKKILLLTIAVLAMSLGVNAEDVPYAEYKNGTLKFKYGDITSSSCSFVWNCENTSSMQAPWNDIKASVEKVEFDSSFKNARPKSCAYWFYMFKALKSIIGIKYLNTSECTSMSNMFKSCELLTDIDVSYFNTLKVKNMSMMFAHCAKLTALNLSSFGIDNVTNMDNMFLECSELTTIYCNEAWSCNSSTNMFYGCMYLKGAVMYSSNNSDVSYANPTTGYFTKRAYGLWIGNQQVETSTDLPTVDGVLSGIVRYTPSTKTLTLQNARITYDDIAYPAAIQSSIDGLNIKLVGKNVVTSSVVKAMALSRGEVTFTGDGTLELSGVSGISIFQGTGLTIADGAKVTVHGQQWGIRSSDNSLFLSLEGKNTMLKVKGDEMGSIVGIYNEYFGDSVYYHDPEGAYVYENSVYGEDYKLCRDWVTIAYGKPDHTVRRIDITNFTWPTDFEPADYEVTSPTKGVKSVSVGYTIGMKTIENYVGSTNDKLGIVFTVELEDDYEFPADKDFSAFIERDGVQVHQDERATGVAANQKRFVWRYIVPTPEGGTYMRTALDTITAPVIGAEPVWEIPASAGAKALGALPEANVKEQFQKEGYCPVNEIMWFEEVSFEESEFGRKDMARGDKFQPGKTYSVIMKISPVSGQQFHDNTVFSMNGETAKVWNSIFANIESPGAYYCLESNTSAKICYVFPALPCYLGDVNMDGSITMADANAVVNYFLASEKPKDFPVHLADVNGDNDVPMADANQIVNLFLSGAESQVYNPASDQ